MGRKVIITALAVCAVFLLGGCLNMINSKDENYQRNADNENMNEYEKENYVPIQEYTGEGFTLRDANPKTGEIAEENLEEVETAVEDFFLNKYKTEVKVHNIVSAVDGVSVFVESIGEPHFYSFAIVPVDIKNKEVKTDEVWSQEGQVEGALRGSLYVMAFEEEFAKLDNYLERVEEEYPVIGMNIEVAENVKGNGYQTPYYFVTSGFSALLDMYLENPGITKEELRAHLDEENPSYSEINGIAIKLFMKVSEIEPDEEIYNEIYTDIIEMDGIPGGSYTIILNDNYIDRQSAIGEKDNTIDKTTPDEIIKD